jgi:hypothetical protein
MSLLVLRCLELVLPFRMVELRILQLKLMSPHREPSPVHYMTKPPVTAAYLRGRRCCLCQRDFILDNRRVIFWCLNLWYLYFLREPVPIFIFTFLDLAWSVIHLQINLSLHLFLGPGCENFKTFRECCENEGS